jgi:hypothetical protein
VYSPCFVQLHAIKSSNPWLFNGICKMRYLASYQQFACHWEKTNKTCRTACCVSWLFSYSSWVMIFSLVTTQYSLPKELSVLLKAQVAAARCQSVCMFRLGDVFMHIIDHFRENSVRPTAQIGWIFLPFPKSNIASWSKVLRQIISQVCEQKS